MKKSTLLIGRGTIAVQCLQILEKNKQLPQVIICDPDDPGIDTWTKSLLKYAKKLGYKLNTNLYATRKINTLEFLEEITHKHPSIDIIFSIQPKSLFKKSFLSLAREYVINLHFSPLPKLRGVSTSPWAILDGLKQMGVTLHIIDGEGIDDGPIVAQKRFVIKKYDTSREIYDKSLQYATVLFEKNIKKILESKIHPVPQLQADATYHPLHELDLQQAEVDLSKNSQDIVKFIRSRIFPPFQLPFFMYQGKKVYINRFKTRTNKLKKGKSPTIEKQKQNYIIYLSDLTIVIKSTDIKKL